MEHMVNIRCKNNGKTLQVPAGSTLQEIYERAQLQMDFGPVSAKVNNKVEGMTYHVYHAKDVEFLDLHSSSGMRAYTRTLFFVLCRAVNELFPEGKVVIDGKAIAFVPICTKQAFLKYYTEDANALLAWSRTDSKKYLEDITQKLEDFLK